MAQRPDPPAVEYRLRIRELPAEERPRERLRDYGPSALSSAELLAIILRVGTAKENAVRLAQRLLAVQPEDRVTVSSPEDVFTLVQGELALLEQEHLRVVLLTTRNQVVGVHELYKGSVNSAQVRVSEVLRPAVRENCPALVVVHNHPSGDPTPSAPDVTLTKELVAAGKLLNIDVLDHIIVAQGRFVSMKEKGLGS